MNEALRYINLFLSLFVVLQYSVFIYKLLRTRIESRFSLTKSTLLFIMAVVFFGAFAAWVLYFLILFGNINQADINIFANIRNLFTNLGFIFSAYMLNKIR